jgi:uncharacterized protein (TIGR03118 family)
MAFAMHLPLARTAILSATAAGCLGGASVHAATTFEVTNLVSDGSVPAATTDPNLKNPWGVSFAPKSPMWVSDNGTGVATLYTGAGAKVALTVTIPPDGSNPTGQVFNSTTDFKLNGSPSLFIFDTENGTIASWNGGTTATQVYSEDGAVYKGLAIGNNGTQNLLYAANFNSGLIEEFNSAFTPVGGFTDPTVPAGYAPFNVQVLNGHLFVTYAVQNGAKHDDVAGPGNGVVDEFNLDGTLVKRLVSPGGEINSPWGLDIAPASFGTLAGDLLVGNFGDGTISAFDPTTGAFEGKLLLAGGTPFQEGDLWALVTGNGGPGFDSNKVYFTAGLVEESEGLFGSIAAVPEPMTWTMMILGVGMVGVALRRRRLGARGEALLAIR